MRLFFISASWLISYLFFKVILLGNRRVLSRLEKHLFKIAPLKPVKPIESNIALDLAAEYEISATKKSRYTIQYANCDTIYAGMRVPNKSDRVAIPIRVFCPIKAKSVLLVGKYQLLEDPPKHYYHAGQEFTDVKPGWFDGVVFAEMHKENAHTSLIKEAS